MPSGTTGPTGVSGAGDPARPSDESGARLLLALALALGLVRFWRLGTWSLWIDEALTLADSLKGTSFRNFLGYGLMGVYLDQLPLRPDEFALRLPAAVLGWLSLPLTAWAFAPLVGRRAAAGGALLMALSSWHVYWSQNARFYTFALVLSVLGSGLTIRGLVQGRLAQLAAGLAVAAAAGLAHPGAFTLLPVLVAAPSVARAIGRPLPGSSPRTERRLFALGLLGVLAGLPWARGVWETWKQARGGGTPVHFVMTVGYFFTPLLGAAALAAGVLAFRARRAGALFTALVALGVLALWIAVATLARASAQFVFFLLPWVVTLAATPLAQKSATTRGAPGASGAAWMFVLCLTLGADLGLYFTERGGGRPPWRDAYRYVWNQRSPGDLIFGMEAPVGEYYLDPTATELRTPASVTYLNRERPEWLDLWSRRPRRTWYVINREQMNDLRPPDRAELARILREECHLAKSFELRADARDLSVHVYLRDT